MTYLTEALARLIPAVRGIRTDVSDAPDLLAAAIHQIEEDARIKARLTDELGRRDGLNSAQAAQRTSGTGADTREGVIGGERAVSADVRGRITPVASVDPADWYDDRSWADRDDAHRVTFEGEGA